MDKILKQSTTAKGMNFDLNEIRSPAKTPAVSAVAEVKKEVSSTSAINSAYLKKTINDENIPPSNTNFSQLPFKDNLIQNKYSAPIRLSPTATQSPERA